MDSWVAVFKLPGYGDLILAWCGAASLKRPCLALCGGINFLLWRRSSLEMFTLWSIKGRVLLASAHATP